MRSNSVSSMSETDILCGDEILCGDRDSFFCDG